MFFYSCEGCGENHGTHCNCFKIISRSRRSEGMIVVLILILSMSFYFMIFHDLFVSLSLIYLFCSVDTGVRVFLSLLCCRLFSLCFPATIL